MSAQVLQAGRVPEWKVEEVSELVRRINQSRVIGIVGVRDLPASDFQRMRGELRATSEIKMVRNNIARRALEQAGESIRPLADYIDDQTALIFSQSNPFTLKKLLDAGKRPMPIKAGSKAPTDIVVEAGDTSFSPGPMVGKLQSAGIPAAIKGGKVVINQRTVLVKEGDVVAPKLAEVLQLMEIFPRNIGLELRAAYEGGLVFMAKDLTIDVDSVLADISVAASRAFSFAVEVSYVTPDTVAPILQRAQAKARAVVAEAAIPVPGMMTLVLARANANAQAIAGLMSPVQAPAAAPVEKKAEAEAKAEESKEAKEEDTAAGLGSLFG